MQDPGLAHLSGATGLDIVDLISDDATAEHLLQLQMIHGTFFGSYTNVVPEIQQFQVDKSDVSVTRHAWLVSDGDTAVGEIIFHTSHNYKIGVIHFVAMREDVRQQLKLGWFNSLIEAVVLSVQFDLQRDGSSLSALIAEIPFEDLPRWERVGFKHLNVDYVEPQHGRSWKLHGDLTFSPMTAVLKCLPTQDTQFFNSIALNALNAFLVEHYDLDSEHPEVQRMLNAVSLLTE